MKVVSDLSDAAAAGPCVLTIGNFDGLHLGHQQILRTVCEKARGLKLLSAVLTFEPHPVRILSPSRAPKLISTSNQKVRLIEACGIDTLFLARFDSDFASLTPDAFIAKYLVEGLNARALCVGTNFTFGHKQSGNIETLRKWRDHFDLIEVPPVVTRGRLVSSTLVRQLVQEGKVSEAGRLLGRWFEIEGRIVAGTGRGRTLTVPTLNLSPENELLPAQGVYVTRASVDSSGFIEAVTNIGNRPTFNGHDQTIETFLLSGSVPSDPHKLQLQFLRRLRGERRFESPELLRQQILLDVAAAQRFYRRLRAASDAGIHTN